MIVIPYKKTDDKRVETKMVFSSLTFLCLFLPVVVGLHSLVKNGTARNAILLISSLLFYAWGEPVWIVAMLFATAVNYVCARIIAGARTPGGRKLALAVGIIAVTTLVRLTTALMAKLKNGEWFSHFH